MLDCNAAEAGDDALPPPAPRLSAVFIDLDRETQGPVSVEIIRDALGDRSLAALLLFFAAINMLPLPPGGSAILGVPLLIIAAQMVYGARTAWLPRRVLDKQLSRDHFERVVRTMVPWLQRLEKHVRPRYWPFWPHHGERIVGGMALVMAIAVTLPIPLGNWLPALSSALMALALSERDGVLLGIACIVATVALFVIGLVIGSAGIALEYAWATVFGF